MTIGEQLVDRSAARLALYRQWLAALPPDARRERETLEKLIAETEAIHRGWVEHVSDTAAPPQRREA